jgi:hypothetical protein
MILKELSIGAFFVFNGMRLMKTNKMTYRKWVSSVSNKGELIYVNKNTEVEQITINEWRNNE